MRWSNLDSDWIQFSILIITFAIESQIWWFNPERRFKGLQLLCWSLFRILSFDNWYLTINTPSNCRSELNIHIKSSLEIRKRFKFRNSLLSLSFNSFPYSFLCYKCSTHQRQRWERSSRDRFLGQFFILFSVGFYFHIIYFFL